MSFALLVLRVAKNAITDSVISSRAKPDLANTDTGTDTKKRAPGSFQALLYLLQIEVHEKLVRMRAKAQGIVLLFLQFDPILEEIFGEDISLKQEFVVFLERFDCTEERIGHRRNLGEFFRRKFVKILVERIARINSILDAVQTSKQQCRETEVRSCGRDRGCGTRRVSPWDFAE